MFNNAQILKTDNYQCHNLKNKMLTDSKNVQKEHWLGFSDYAYQSKDKVFYQRAIEFNHWEHVRIFTEKKICKKLSFVEEAIVSREYLLLKL